MKATYTAAEAQTKINEAFTGISTEFADVGQAVQRAEDKTAQMQARAAPSTSWSRPARSPTPPAWAKDDLTLELERMSSQSDVERELSRLKKEIAPGAAAPQIAPAQTSDAAATDQPEASA